MLAALNISAIGLGLGAGGLVATVFALLLGSGLELLGVRAGADIGLVVGVLGGLCAGGWVSGRQARHSERFHGSVTGLAIAALLVVVARLGGSPADGGVVAWLSVLAITVSGFFGWVAAVKKRRRLAEASSSDGRSRETEESPDSEGQGAG